MFARRRAGQRDGHHCQADAVGSFMTQVIPAGSLAMKKLQIFQRVGENSSVIFSR